MRFNDSNQNMRLANGEQMPSADYDWDVWDKCCASYNSPYEFVLMVDGIACVRKVYTVGSPNEDPRMEVVSPVRGAGNNWPSIGDKHEAYW